MTVPAHSTDTELHMPAQPYNILIAATLSPDGLAVLRAAEDVRLQSVPQTREGIMPHLEMAHAIIVSDLIQVDKDVMDAAPNLRIIARAGSSLVNVNVDEATRRGIMVMNTPGVDAVTVAEYTFALMLALVRSVMGAHHYLLDGIWNRDLYVGNQLQGKTLGIIGFGRVGREVASRAIAFGLDVVVSDPYIAESQIGDLRLKLV
ncbi:MAG TPA: NAD(P)-dependent oxidoreductase, partial [Aggregatilineales bacterium]|nr:NAD(P)-dependent oxidoreductase [Aggregatilineales bacterium]